MMKTENPAALAGANRVLEIAATTKKLDTRNPIETHPHNQSELLAIANVMRRCHVSIWHAKTICQLSGLGGRQA